MSSTPLPPPPLRSDGTQQECEDDLELVSTTMTISDVPVDVLGTIICYACNHSRTALELAKLSQQWYIAFEDCCESLWVRLIKRKFPALETTLSEELQRKALEAKSVALSEQVNKENDNDGEQEIDDAEFAQNLHSCRAFHRFKQLVTGANRLKPIQCAGLRPIEECDFLFKCPVFTANLKATNKVSSFGNPIMFCDVCNRDVHLVTSQEEIDEAKKTRRCVRFSRFSVGNGVNFLRLGQQTEGYRVCVVDAVGGSLALQTVHALLAVAPSNRLTSVIVANNASLLTMDATSSMASLRYQGMAMHFEPATMDITSDEEKLPEGWEKDCVEATGEEFYYNRSTNVSQWNPPKPDYPEPVFDRSNVDVTRHVRCVTELFPPKFNKAKAQSATKMLPSSTTEDRFTKKINVVVFIGTSDLLVRDMEHRFIDDKTAASTPVRHIPFVMPELDTCGSDTPKMGDGVAQAYAKALMMKVKDTLHQPIFLGGLPGGSF